MILFKDNKSVIDYLIEVSRQKGYVTIDDVINSVDTFNLPLEDIDRICENLIASEVIILEEEKSNNSQDEENSYDRSRLDYEEIFKRIIKIDPSLTSYINEIRVIQPPQNREEATLIGPAKEGNVYAKERLISMFLRVVVRIALWFYDTYSLPLAESIQDGNIGLIKAIEKFSYSSDNRFSTYAPWWIRQSINRFTIDAANSYYVPAHLKEQLFSVRKIIIGHTCEKCLDAKPCPNLINQINTELILDNKTTLDYLRILDDFYSIEECLENDESIFSDFGEFNYILMDGIINEDNRRLIKSILLSISEKERRVIILRNGLNDGKTRTLEEIGSILRVTRERIRQIEAKAIKKLRHPSRAKILKL